MLARFGVAVAYALVVAGVALVSVPAALIVAGLVLGVVAALFVDIPAKEPRR